jgi:hypothetical protein
MRAADDAAMARAADARKRLTILPVAPEQKRLQLVARK